MGYVTRSGSSSTQDIFVEALQHADDVDSLVVYRGNAVFALMNLYPYNTGHVMVIPNEKVASIEYLTPQVRAELFETVNLIVEAARTVLRCDGFNIGLNLGQIAGAGVADHLHIHIVPRWVGDANFMPITANTMVLPELIHATCARMRGEIETMLAREAAVPHLDAGCVAILPGERLVILRRAANGEYVLPKGHIEEGESAAEAAVREVHEETGYRATIVGWAGADRFRAPDDEDAHVVYFLAIGESTPDTKAHLGNDTFLVPYEEAPARLDFPALATIVSRALELAEIAANNRPDAL